MISESEVRAHDQEEKSTGVMPTSQFEREVREGQRFQFGQNWRAFHTVLDEERIQIAEQSLQELLGCTHLHNKTFLDVGSGSGLSSLAARKLGATVCSLDFDPHSVACTCELRSRYFPQDTAWTIYEASVLDNDFLRSLGKFDIVYSWGVLHHTGHMWDALENVSQRMRHNGVLCLAIYNDVGRKSLYWWRGVKRFYCSGVLGKIIVTSVFFPYLFFKKLLACLWAKKNVFATVKRKRGMSMLHDWHDWLGGYPYEVARVDQIFKYYRDKGLVITNLETTSGRGCNQFVFEKQSEEDNDVGRKSFA
jgi:2-polyprenyl-3-methyl-5-hydroxy-6-metoxy-1,4-benzoquinol methylase